MMLRVMRVVGIIWFILCMAFGIASYMMMTTYELNYQTSEKLTMLVFFIAISIIGIIPTIIHASKIRREAKQALEHKMSAYNATHYTSLQLVSGLPFAENTSCQLFLSPSNLIIEALSQHYTIDISQILAAQTKGDTEIIQEVTSSGGKALVGGLLFGPVGAIIGARTKTKKTAKVTFYLIINYINKNNETDVLAFTSGEGYPFSGQCDKISKPLTEWITAQRGGTVTAL